MKNYLAEAFKKLDILDEEVFEIDNKGIAELKDFEDHKSEDDEVIQIIDVDAETEEELKDSYIGKVILDCCVCHSKIYKDKEDVVLDEEGELANVSEECPYCYSSDGFKIIGQVSEFCAECEDEEKHEEEEEKEEAEEKSEESSDEVEVEVKEKEKVSESFISTENGYFTKLGAKNIKDSVDIGLNDFYDPYSGVFSFTKEEYDANKEKIQQWVESHPTYGLLSQDAEIYSGSGLEDSSDGKAYFLTDYGFNDSISDVLIAPKMKEANEAFSVKSIGRTIKGKIKESVSKRDDIDAEADDRKKRIKKAYLKARDDIDADRDYRLKKKITRKTESKCLKEEPIYGLEPRYDARKSFYGKAQVDIGDKGDKNRLYSYDTLVAEIKDGKPYVYGTYSQTTLRHIKDWLKQNGFKAESGKQIMADYGAELGESLESVSVDTGDQIIDVYAHDKNDVKEEEVEEKEETIVPVSDETKDEIKANSDEYEDEVEVEVSDFDTDEFDELGESYLKRAYSNVDSYKTEKVLTDKGLLKLEGIIKFTSGNSKKTTFIFESKELCSDGRAKFVGENAQICKGKKAFTVKGKLSEGKFLPESFNYNYKAKDAETGISKRVYGTLRSKKR